MIILTEFEQTTTSKGGTVASTICSDRDTQSRATQYRRPRCLLQAGTAPPVQREAHRHITERLVRLKQMLLNGDINVHQHADSVGGDLKLRN